MLELLRVIEEPRQCSYLPEEVASLEIRLVAGLSPGEYADLMARGYRRFGMQVFRPACEACSECRSIRVLAQEFVPSRNHKRVFQNNQHIRAELHPAFATTEHVELFNRYHRFMEGHRGWPLQQVTPETYYRDFITGATSCGKQWLYFDEEELVGVALMDEVPDAISLVYCYYHPDWRGQSPGTYSILNQLSYARSRGLKYVYPGYWMPGCQSLSYKSRYRPFETLQRHPHDWESPEWKL